MRKFFAVILMDDAVNLVSGCMMMHNGFHGQEHQEGEGPGSTRDIEPRNNHSTDEPAPKISVHLPENP